MSAWVLQVWHDGTVQSAGSHDVQLEFWQSCDCCHLQVQFLHNLSKHQSLISYEW